LKDLIISKVDFRSKVIRLIAEICKQGSKKSIHTYILISSIINYSTLESERKECVQIDLVSPLKEPLQSGSIQDKLESCRAIGNMCYENGSIRFENKFRLNSIHFFRFS